MVIALENRNTSVRHLQVFVVVQTPVEGKVPCSYMASTTRPDVTQMTQLVNVTVIRVLFWTEHARRSQAIITSTRIFQVVGYFTNLSYHAVTDSF